MGAPQTLPADFQGWDQQPAKGEPPSTLPPDFDKWDQPQQASATNRFGNNFLSGLGVVSDEQAKNFFLHPINTAMGMVNGQGELAQAAKDAYARGDYKSAVIHGLNYLVPFIGQQTDKAGEQLSQGDIAGGIGRMLGVAVPIAAGSPDVQSAASSAARSAADTGAATVRAAARGVNTGLAKAPGTIGATVGAAIGGKFGGTVGAEVGGAAGALAGRELLPQVRIPGEGFGLPSRVTGGPAVAPAYEAPGSAGSIAESVTKPAPVTVAQPVPESEFGAPSGISNPLHGESALTDILTKLDNQTLLKIAKSRGISVSQVQQLKPGVANPQLIKNIVADYSPDELAEISGRYLENTRQPGHNFGDLPDETWRVMTLSQYFPEVRIPLTQLRRAAISIQGGKK